METNQILSVLVKTARHIKNMQKDESLFLDQIHSLENEVEDLESEIEELESDLNEDEKLQLLGSPIGDLDDLVLAVDYARRKQWNNAAFYLARAIPDLDFTHLFEVKP